MSREVKSHVVRSVSPSAQGISASFHAISPVPLQDRPTQREDEESFQAEEASVRLELQTSETSEQRGILSK